MDKTIDIYVNGSYLRKNSNIAGVQGEGNAGVLHITFDDSWADMAKSVTFWDSRGENPVIRTLTADLLTDLTTSLLEYNVPIPAEPMAYEGKLTFIIDGYTNGVRMRSTQDNLNVLPAMIADAAAAPADPTPTQAEQLQTEIENLLGNVQKEAIKAQTAADAAEVSENNAKSSETEAALSAEQAKISEESASSSASLALESASSAKENANTAKSAQTAAETAKDIALSAKEEALTAKTAAESAQSKAEEAQSKAETAQSASEAAQGKAEAAQSAAESARLGAETAYASAKASADVAAESADKSTDKAAEATNQALLSKSYAVGGTGARTGEETDNAKYYCEQAQSIVGGDYVTNTQLEAFKTTNIVPLEYDISELQTKEAENETSISGLSTEVNSVKEKANTNETNISSLQSKANEMEGNIAGIYESLNDYSVKPSAFNKGNIAMLNAEGNAQDSGLAAQAVSEHINDKNNPHGVTAKQIGAVGCSTPMTFSVTVDGILQVTYDDGL